MKSLVSSRVAGTGSAFPERIVTNEELCRLIQQAIVSTSTKHTEEGVEGFGPEWIRERTGIVTRHFLGPGESLSGLSAVAADRALASAGMSIASIDGILLATCTPEQSIPATATLVHRRLGAGNAFAMDLNAACSGFHHAWATGHAMIAAGIAKNLLVIGADVLSAVTDFTDRKSAILFGDGAGAMVLSRDDSGSGIPPRFALSADGTATELFQIVAGGSARPPYGMQPAERRPLAYSETRMQMKGAEIFKASVRAMVDLSNEVLATMGMTTANMDHVVPHQANLRILEMVAKKQGISLDRFVLNIAERGNTSAATVPTAFDSAVRSGRIRRGQKILVPVFGAGTTAGAAVIHY